MSLPSRPDSDPKAGTEGTMIARGPDGGDSIKLA
jgi:hypothetical protein